MRKLIGGVLRLYKVVVSPFLPSACRYYPSCSEYMRQAVEKYGVAPGVWMGVKRLSRCHPFYAGGVDPVRGRAGKLCFIFSKAAERPGPGPPATSTIPVKPGLFSRFFSSA